MATFQLRILSLRGVLFDKPVSSVYLFGDEGEYELLAFHYDLLGALPAGEVKIAGYPPVPLRTGVVLFQNNICTIIVEEQEDRKRATAAPAPAGEAAKST